MISQNNCQYTISHFLIIPYPLLEILPPGQQARRSMIFSIARQPRNVRFLELPSQSTDRAFLLCNGEENLGDHIF